MRKLAWVVFLVGCFSIGFFSLDAAVYWRNVRGNQRFLDNVKVDEGEFYIGDTAMTTSAAEQNVLDGVTAGVVTSNKAIVAGSSRTIDQVTITTATATNFKLGSTLVTSSAAELNILDNVTSDYADLNRLDNLTPGTAVANKAVVINGSRTIDVLNIGTSTITTGTVTTADINGGAIDATTIGAGTPAAATMTTATATTLVVGGKTLAISGGTVTAGQSAVTITVAGTDSDDLVLATSNTAGRYVKSAVPGTGNVVVTLDAATTPSATTVTCQVWQD